MSFALEQHSDVTCDGHDHQSIHFDVCCCRKKGPGLVDEQPVSISRQQSDWRPRSGPGYSLTVADRTQSQPATVLASKILNEFCFVQKWPTCNACWTRTQTKVEKLTGRCISLWRTRSIFATLFPLICIVRQQCQDFMGNTRRFLNFYPLAQLLVRICLRNNFKFNCNQLEMEVFRPLPRTSKSESCLTVTMTNRRVDCSLIRFPPRNGDRPLRWWKVNDARVMDPLPGPPPLRNSGGLYTFFRWLLLSTNWVIRDTRSWSSYFF